MLRRRDQQRFDAALAHGALSTTPTAPEPESPSLPGSAAGAATGAAGRAPLAALAQDSGGAGERHCRWSSDLSTGNSSGELEVEEEVGNLKRIKLLRREAVAVAKEDFAFESTMAWREARYWEVRTQHTHARVITVVPGFSMLSL